MLAQVTNVLLMVVRLDIHTEPISKQCHRGFRGPGAPAFAGTASGSLHDGDRANFSYEKEKSVSVVRLQVAKAYWAYALCMMPSTSDRTSVAVFAHRNDDTRRVYANGPRRTPEAKLSDESLITPWLWH